MSSLENDIARNDVSYVTGAVPKLVNYTDGTTYDYVCTARPGVGLTDQKWRVFRVTKATGDIVHADSGRFSQRATSLAVVAALSYT